MGSWEKFGFKLGSAQKMGFVPPLEDTYVQCFCYENVNSLNVCRAIAVNRFEEENRTNKGKAKPALIRLSDLLRRCHFENSFRSLSIFILKIEMYKYRLNY